MKSLIASAILIVAFAAPASAQTTTQTRVFGMGAVAGQRVDLGDRGGDAAVFGEEINVPGRIGGDVFAAGRSINVTGTIAGDLRAFGEEILLPGAVEGEVSLAGQEIEIAGIVGRELHAAGQSVRVTDAAQIGQDARVAGEDVNIAGRFAGDLSAAGETVLIDAIVQGDVDVRARSLTIGPNAAITGRLTWRAAQQPTIDPGAAITGGSEGRVGAWRDRHWHYDMNPAMQRNFEIFGRIAFGIGWAITAFLIGMVIALAAPAYFDRATAGLRERPLPAFGWGLLLIIAPIVLAIVLMATLIGIPIAIMIVLCYWLWLAAGYALGAAAFGALAVRAQTNGGRLGALALGVIAVGALALIPWIGAAIAFVVMILGLGLFVVARRPAPLIVAAGPGS